MFIWVLPCALLTLAHVVAKGQCETHKGALKRLNREERNKYGQERG